MEGGAESVPGSSTLTTRRLCLPARGGSSWEENIMLLLFCDRPGSQAEGGQKPWASEPWVQAVLRATALAPACSPLSLQPLPAASLCLCLTSVSALHFSPFPSHCSLPCSSSASSSPLSLSPSLPATPLLPQSFLDYSFQEYKVNRLAAFK